MRADAFKIVTDEAWHAQFSFDLISEVAAATGVAHEPAGAPAFAGRLDAIRRRLPPDVRGAEALLFAVVSETLISRMLADLPRDSRLPVAVRESIRDHAADEGRHHAYFTSLLRVLWPALGRSAQRQIGPWIPEMIYTFLEPDYEAMAASLRHEGLAPAAIQQVLIESWPRDQVVHEIAEASRAATRYFAEVGALREPRTRDAFLLAGLLDPLA